MRYDSTKKLFLPYLNGIAARYLSFSSDGKWVSYRNEVNGTLWRSRADGTQAIQLTFPPLDAFTSTWSPDGRRIIFEGSGKLFVLSSDGGKPEALMPANPSGLQPNWSPDGRRIVFVRWVSNFGGDSTANVLDLGTGKVQIMDGGLNYENPQWSPDGKYMVAGDRAGQKLMLFDVERNQWSKLADGRPYGLGIRWSSDSKFVYYQMPFSGEEQPLHRVAVNDHKVEQVTSARQILRADVLSYTMTGLTPGNSPLASLVHRSSDIYALELELP